MPRSEHTDLFGLADADCWFNNVKKNLHIWDIYIKTESALHNHRLIFPHWDSPKAARQVFTTSKRFWSVSQLVQICML